MNIKWLHVYFLCKELYCKSTIAIFWVKISQKQNVMVNQAILLFCDLDFIDFLMVAEVFTDTFRSKKSKPLGGIHENR